MLDLFIQDTWIWNFNLISQTMWMYESILYTAAAEAAYSPWWYFTM